MKISQEIRAQTDSAAKTDRPSIESRQSFNSMVQSQTEKLKQQELKQLVENITTQGEKLARFRSFRDLVKFKRMVKRFLQESVYNGLDLQHSHSFRLDGQNRKLQIVKEIDEKLVEITDEVLNQQQKNVDLLGLIGEIKGLLINLYM